MLEANSLSTFTYLNPDIYDTLFIIKVKKITELTVLMHMMLNILCIASYYFLYGGV